MIRYLLDEHIPKWYRTALKRAHPALPVWRIGDPGAPPLRSDDPDILCWCEEHQFILITDNRKTMPVHLHNHLAQGRHIPGIFVISPGLAVGEVIEELVLIAGASFAGEYADRVEFLPLT